MTMKNKLYKHHKSVASYYLRRFSLSVLALFFVGGAAVIPTYISTISNQQISTKAETVEEEKVEENNQTNESEIVISDAI